MAPSAARPDRQVVDDHDGRFAGDPARLDQPAPSGVGLAPGQVARRPGPAAPTPPRDSSAVRAGASPIQNGTVGGRSPASRTRTTPGSTLRICQEWLPSRKMSPAIDSTAQSSSTVPTSDVVGIGHDAVVTGLGDGAPRGGRGQPGTLPGAQLAVDGVVVEVGAPPAPAGLDALAHQVDDLVELARG